MARLIPALVATAIGAWLISLAVTGWLDHALTITIGQSR